MDSHDELLLVVLRTLRALITKQCEALNLQTALLEDVVRGQTQLVDHLRTLTEALADRQRSVH